MADWDFYLRGFEYDLWANKLWLASLLGKQFPEPDTEIFAHILAAQSIWLSRVNGDSPSAMPEIEPTEAELNRLNPGWTQVLASAADDRMVDFRRTTGEQLRLPLSEIARHVANHGTYHRGELRGLCLARNDGGFPETDYSRFAVVAPRLS